MLGLPFTPLEVILVGGLFLIMAAGVMVNVIVALAEHKAHTQAWKQVDAPHRQVHHGHMDG